MTRGTVLKLALAVAMLGGSGTALYFELRPDPSEMPPAPAPRPVVTLAERIKVTDPEDAALMASLSQGDRYVTLPVSQFAQCSRDANGDVWFNDTRVAEGEFERSIERAAHGLTRIIRGSELILVDRQHRFWCRKPGEPGEVICYDGKQWLAPHASESVQMAGKYAPKDHPRMLTVAFADSAVQDSAGNCYFLAAKKDYPAHLHRYGVDGTWSTFAFPEGVAVEENWKAVAQNNGRIAFYAQERMLQGNGVSPMLAQAILTLQKQKDSPLAGMPLGKSDSDAGASACIWDGQQFSTFTEKDSANTDKPLNGVTPLPDGSLLLTYQGSEDVALRWPSGRSERLDDAAQKLIADLAAREPSKRTSALDELIRLGPQIRPFLQAALADPANAAPQRQASLQEAIDQLDRSGKSADTPSVTLFGGRYDLKSVQEAAHGPDGSVLLFAYKCTDVPAGKALGACFLSIDASGKWTARPLPDMRTAMQLHAIASEGMLDSNNRLWIQHRMGNAYSKVLDLGDFSLHPALPPGAQVDDFRTSDRSGRVYCRLPRGVMMIDPSKAEPSGDQLAEQVTARAAVQASGEKDVWLQADPPVHVDAAGHAQTIAAPGGRRCMRILPMRGGAAYLYFEPTPDPRSLQPSFWHDGMLDSPMTSNVHDEIELHADDLMRATSFDFGLQDGGYAIERLASDQGKGIWCSWREAVESDGIVMDNDIPRHLDYFDGTAWHDAWDLLKNDYTPDADDPKPLALQRDFAIIGAIDHGHTVIIRSNHEGTLSTLTFTNGHIQRTPIDGVPMTASVLLQSAGDKVWLGSVGQNGGALVSLEGGKATSEPWRGEPLLIDAKERLWCRKDHTLSVSAGGKVGSLDVADMDQKSTLVESPDGRLWLLHSGGLDEVQVDGSGTPKLGYHRGWLTPINDFAACCDGANNVWLGGSGGEVAKIKLP